MDTVTLRSAEILAAFDGPLPGVYFGLSAEIQARIFTALAAFLAEHPSLPPLSTPSYGVRWPEVESQPGTRTWNHRGRRAQSRFAYLYGVDLAAPGERPVLTVPQVFALARQMLDRYRALILLATFASLRWGEAVALQRKDVDPDRGTMDVRQALIERTNGEVAIGPPKSRAGRRLVTVPAADDQRTPGRIRPGRTGRVPLRRAARRHAAARLLPQAGGLAGGSGGRRAPGPALP